MKVLLDTKVLIDLFAKRDPWTTEASKIWMKNATGQITGFVTASSLTDLFYLCSRLLGTPAARAAVEVCLGHLETCTVSRIELELAAGLEGEDFEDNLQIVCAEENKLDAIVTRDRAGFAGSPIQILTPADLLVKMP